MTYLALVFIQLCFASLSIAGRLAFDPQNPVPPNAVVLARLVGGLIVFALLARRKGRFRLDREDGLLLAACALFGVVLNQALFINGLARTTAISANLISATIPAFAAIFAVVLGRERFQWTRAIGIAVAMAGVFVLFDLRELSLAGSHLLGDLLCLVNCASYAMFLVLVRPLSAKYPPMHLVAMLFGVALVLFAPVGVPAWWDLAPRLRARELYLLAFIVAFPTVAAYSLTQWTLRRAEASLVATFIYLQPVFATLLAVLILGEALRPRAAVAAALIFLGVWVSTRRARGAPPPTATPRAPAAPSPSGSKATAAHRPARS